MQLLIRYINGTSETVEASPQADVVSTWMSFRPGVQLLAEPKLCRWGSDFFSAAINEGNLRSGRETSFEEEDTSTWPFIWEVTGSEMEDCQEMITHWIKRLGGDFDPERLAQEYLYGSLLHVLSEHEAQAYANDQKCWTYYLDDPRIDAARSLRSAGIEPTWREDVADPTHDSN